MPFSSHRSQLKVLNCQYFLLPPPLLAADPVGRREKLGSSLTLCSAASTLLCSVGSCSSAGCIVGKSWQEAIAQVWALAAAYPHPHYTAFLHFPLRASNSPLPFRPPSKYLIHFLGSMEVLHICDFSIPLQSFVSKQQPNRIKGNSAH